MPFDLTAASRSPRLVLYDPAALPPDLTLDPDRETPEPNPPPSHQLEALAAAGQALILHIPDDDCEATLRIFVDEPLPPTLPTHAQLPTLENALLQLPSGHLRADGAEFLELPGEPRTYASHQQHKLPPGRYHLNCRSLLLWKAQNRKSEIATRTTPLERFAARLYNSFGCLAALALAVSFLALPALGVYWGEVGWRRTLPVAGRLAAAAAVVFVLFWLLDRARQTLPLFSRASEASYAFDRDFPDFVVELQTPGSAAPTAEAPPPTFLKAP